MQMEVLNVDSWSSNCGVKVENLKKFKMACFISTCAVKSHWHMCLESQKRLSYVQWSSAVNDVVLN
jgi:hypothetical protein